MKMLGDIFFDYCPFFRRLYMESRNFIQLCLEWLSSYIQICTGLLCVFLGKALTSRYFPSNYAFPEFTVKYSETNNCIHHLLSPF